MTDQAKPIEANSFDSVIPWHILKEHLIRQGKVATNNLLNAGDHDEMLRFQAQCVVWKQLLNLPETLKFLNNEPAKEVPSSA